MKLSRRAFLTGLAAASTTTYFDMGKNLWRQKPPEMIGFTSAGYIYATEYNLTSPEEFIKALILRTYEAERQMIKEYQRLVLPVYA